MDEEMMMIDNEWEDENLEPLTEAEIAVLKARLDKMTEVYKKVCADRDAIQAFYDALPGIFERQKTLSDYYTTHQLDDSIRAEELDEELYYEITGEDAIWNVLQDQYSLSLRLIRALANNVTPEE